MPKLTRRTLLQSTALAAVPTLARQGAASVLTVSWDRPRAAPGDTATVVVRGPVPRFRLTLHPPAGPPEHHTLILKDGRAELAVPLPRPSAAGVHVWKAEATGATARLEVIANRFVFGL